MRARHLYNICVFILTGPFAIFLGFLEIFEELLAHAAIHMMQCRVYSESIYWYLFKILNCSFGGRWRSKATTDCKMKDIIT